MSILELGKPVVSLSAQVFQQLLLEWFDTHGRKNLPWQQNKTPYRVWVSEIMLQQTQVTTVIPYFERFMAQFPTLASLANASEDAVLHLWAGLGYYSRARNMLRAAKKVMAEYAGRFPDNLDDLETLPGIGLSTAGAILAIAFNKPAAILDGNVKRVLSRLHAISGAVNDKKIETKLWQVATSYLPKQRITHYTQALMDFGATLCVRSKPLCNLCPFTSYCQAYKQNSQTLFPEKKVKKNLPKREATFLIIKKGKQIFLYRRPPRGIWGGLWSVPEIPGVPTFKAIRLYCLQKFQTTLTDYQTLTSFRHTFTHFHLDIHPVIVNIQPPCLKIMEESGETWYDLATPDKLGLPKPVQSILNNQ